MTHIAVNDKIIKKGKAAQNVKTVFVLIAHKMN
jgi:hypothetical protein